MLKRPTTSDSQVDIQATEMLYASDSSQTSETSETSGLPATTDEAGSAGGDQELLAEPWLGGNSQAFLVSLVFHVVLILALAVVPIMVAAPEVFSFRPIAPIEDETLTLIDAIAISDQPSTEVGANSVFESGMALSTAPVLAELSEIPSPSYDPPAENATFDLSQQIEQAMGLVRSDTVVKGMTGVGTTGTDGAVDRVTYEILRAMEERPTLVVWFFDQSGSLQKRRQEIRDRFDRIYEELGIITDSQGAAAAGDASQGDTSQGDTSQGDTSQGDTSQGDAAEQRSADPPLLTSIFAFGSSVSLLTPKPTADIDKIRQAIDALTQDDLGIERVFTALYKGIEKFKGYRTGRGGANQARNVLFVVVTDERGDDANGLDATIKECRKYAIPVYVIGVPAPFGRDITYVKYVDPDPQFDQSPIWAEVDQGPESVLPERVRLGFREEFADEPVVDSGFGPYALSRLAYETGGIYFTVHPNRRVGSRVRKGEVAPFASNLEYFFDAETMAKYAPDYVSAEDYMKRMADSPLRQTLIRAASLPRVDTLQNPQLRFVRRDDPGLANALTAAQQQSARLDPQLAQLVQLLRMGEAHRNQEISPRWTAGFDLALGTVLAHKVRAEGYNAMLAKAKRGMNFEKPNSNTWVLKPDDEISVGSRLEKEGEQARTLLQQVAQQHRGTPWGLLAEEELRKPVGWKWTEETTDLDPQPANNSPGDNNPAPPQDDQARMLPPPLPKRPLPKL